MGPCGAGCVAMDATRGCAKGCVKCILIAGLVVHAQGFLQGASFDTTGTITPEGMSPGASPPHGHAPMSWQQSLNGNPFLHAQAALQSVDA